MAPPLRYDHRPVQWSEVYDHFKTKLDKRTIVHIWKANTNVTEVVANGYQVLLNVGYHAHSWYLDNLNSVWSDVYTNEPCTGVPDSLCPMIIGGHGEMWGETVDASDIEQTVWPRLGACYFFCLLNSFVYSSDSILLFALFFRRCHRGAPLVTAQVQQLRRCAVAHRGVPVPPEQARRRCSAGQQQGGALFPSWAGLVLQAVIAEQSLEHSRVQKFVRALEIVTFTGSSTMYLSRNSINMRLRFHSPGEPEVFY